jgi:hypothetical protein
MTLNRYNPLDLVNGTLTITDGSKRRTNRQVQGEEVWNQRGGFPSGCAALRRDTLIFANPGTTELPLIDALVTVPDIRYVWGLQEATAVSMADGYAQASGKPAFINLHTAGGLGHGMGSIMNAKIARVPMVITAGQQDLRHS